MIPTQPAVPVRWVCSLDDYHKFKWPEILVAAPNVGDMVQAAPYAKWDDRADTSVTRVMELRVARRTINWKGELLCELGLPEDRDIRWWQSMRP
jgi:hypothetical protein